MKTDRLEQLYKQKLVSPEVRPKQFPLEEVLKKEVTYFPEKPENLDFDFLEIGPGRGDFLFHLAKENPTKKILAIEIGKQRYEKICKRIERDFIKNITIVFGDARIPMHKDLQKTKFEKIFVLFPDPWPKTKHRHNRLLNKDFSRLLCDHLKKDGEFTLATDVKDYATWAMSHFESFNDMKNLYGENVIETSLPDLIPTFFEEKWKEIGRHCNYVRYKKID